MAVVSDKYLALLDKHLMGGVPIERMNMTDAQRLRSSIVFEAYKLWTYDKMVSPLELVRRVSRRMYNDMLSTAQYDPEMKKRCAELGIDKDTVRSHTELCNDVAALNHIVGHFDAPTANIEKAKVIEATDWMIREGMKMGDARAVGKGADLKMALNSNFEAKKNDYDNIAQTAINITGDVSVIKMDRVNYTDEDKKKLAKRYGLTMDDTDKILGSDKGEYVEFEPIEEEPEVDYIESAEQEEQERRDS